MSQREAQKSRVVLVTGLSGAGRTTVLKMLEDHGHESVDNLPQAMMPALLQSATATQSVSLAVGVDVRARGFDAGKMAELIDRYRQSAEMSLHVVFLECDDDVLMQRFTETRRVHPLALERPVGDGIQIERLALAPPRLCADDIIDTTQMSVVDLRADVVGRMARDGAQHMRVRVVSFAYRGGLPREADLVFDMRFLRNPHYDPVLKPLDGRDPAVAAYIRKDPDFEAFYDRLTGFLSPLLPHFRAEGKSYLTFAIGCTGGQHRSVYGAESNAKWLIAQGLPVTVHHRELGVMTTASPLPM